MGFRDDRDCGDGSSNAQADVERVKGEEWEVEKWGNEACYAIVQTVYGDCKLAKINRSPVDRWTGR